MRNLITGYHSGEMNHTNLIMNLRNFQNARRTIFSQILQGSQEMSGLY